MGLFSDGICSEMDQVIERPHTFNSPSTLVSNWIDRGDCRMINILWQGLVRGGSISQGIIWKQFSLIGILDT